MGIFKKAINCLLITSILILFSGCGPQKPSSTQQKSGTATTDTTQKRDDTAQQKSDSSQTNKDTSKSDTSK